MPSLYLRLYEWDKNPLEVAFASRHTAGHWTVEEQWVNLTAPPIFRYSIKLTWESPHSKGDVSVSTNQKPVSWATDDPTENSCFRFPPPASRRARGLTPAPGSRARQAQGRTLSSTQVSLTCATCLPTVWTMTGWTPSTGFSLDTCHKKHVSENITRALQLEILEVANNYDMEKLRSVRNNKHLQFGKFKPQDTFDI